MAGSHEHSGPLSDAEAWDRRYEAESGHRIWSGQPNPVLITEIADLAPGRALDVGCGEGADAIWLASRRWRVTGLDISGVALDRAREAAEQAGVTVQWIHGDFVKNPPSGDTYDLVTAHYPALLRSESGPAIDGLLDGVAPGGTLLFVGHHLSDPEEARSHGFEPDDYVQPQDVAARLDDNWTIDVYERRKRERPSSGRSPHTEDMVLKATRQG